MAVTKVPGELIEPVVSGVKTFTDGISSGEEVLINSTLNPYASVKSPNASGSTKQVKIISGDSTSGDAGDVGLESGSATPTAPAVLVIQGLSITELGVTGKAAADGWVDIIIDNTNITNPASPAFNARGGGGQKLEIRVNSATTVNDVVAAFPSSGLTGAFSISGSGLTTFTNGSAAFVAGNDYGATYLKSNNRIRLEADVIQMGKSTASGQAVFQGLPRTSGNSDTVFLLSGRVVGSGNSGSISIRSADMEGSGGSGGTFLRTGSVNGSTASGSTTVSTGATTTYATAASGGLNLTTGNIGGTAGNSGAITMNSGNINSGTGNSGQVNISTGANNLSGGSGITGNATFRSGDMSGTNSGATGSVTVRSGNKTNASATGNTGSLILNSGNNSGAGASGSITMQSGTTTTALSGTLSINSGDTTSTTNGTGSVTLKSGNKATGTGATGVMTVQSGNITTSGSGNSGQTNLLSGNVVDGTSGSLQVKSGSASGVGSSGNVDISSGNVVGGTSGDLTLSTGTVSGGTRGKIKLRDGTQGTVGHIWTQVLADGTGSWQANAAEANTASNLGAGSQVFKQKSGVDLQFRSLVAGSNITLTQNANDITIASSGGGGVTAGMYVYAYSSTGVNYTIIGANTWYNMPFDTVVEDTNGIYNTSSGVITIPPSYVGTYHGRIKVTYMFNGTALQTGKVMSYIKKNTLYHKYGSIYNNAGDDIANETFSSEYVISGVAGDTYEVFFQSNYAGMEIAGGPGTSRIEIEIYPK